MHRSYPVIAALLCGTPILLSAQTLVNVAPLHDLTFLEGGDSYGSGASFHDFDNDGWDDLTFARFNDSLMFYKNVEGQLVRLPSFVHGIGQTRHVLWADHDNDGDKDLVVTTYMGTCRIFNNDGNFNFTDVSAAAGIIQNSEKTYGAAFGDYDNDGWLDLYVCTYEHEGDESMYNRLNHLYRNNGDGTFIDVTLAAGVGDGIKLSFQAMWLDYDHDGWQDLYVINDRWFSNSMYHNNGDGTFTNVADLNGTALPAQDPMSISQADFDADGDIDLFISNSGFLQKNCKLLENNGDGTFAESSIESGIELYDWCWGAAWIDVLNNGDPGIHVTAAVPNATITPNYHFGNLGNGQFVDAISLFQSENNSRSFSPVIGDLNNDGFSDMAVQNQTPWPPYLWKNTGGSNHFVKITLEGTVSNRDAVGSWIHIWFNGKHRVKYTVCGENYLGQSSQHHIMGLGNATLIDSIQVHYLSGHIDRYHSLAPDTSYHFTEGETYTAQISPAGPLTLCPGGDPIVLDAGQHAAWEWNTGSAQQTIMVDQSGEYSVIVWNDAGLSATATVQVTTAPDPQIEQLTAVPSCWNSADGSITLTSGTGADLNGIIWNTGSTGPLLENIPAGTYSYSFSDQWQCDHTDELLLAAPDPLSIQADATPASGGNNGSIAITATGGTPPYSIELNGEEVESPITGIASGEYNVAVIDANGCTGEIQVLVDKTTGITTIDGNSGMIHPNPVIDLLFFPHDLKATGISIFDPEGRLVWRIDGTLRSPIDLSLLRSGLYLIEIRYAEGVIERSRVLKLP